MTIDDLLREAERESRRELEEKAIELYEVRARMPTIVRKSIAQLLEEADDLEHARELAGLERDDRPNPAEPTTRGFKYVSKETGT
ncbi:hypothetical protein [Natronorubrum sp. FCH18a]|uniref:hypothetical protein n=1 Tax=Natronorubrum sp. FCH18a TaxID=3447018 RepID=UPI003F5175F6